MRKTFPVLLRRLHGRIMRRMHRLWSSLFRFHSGMLRRSALLHERGMLHCRISSPVWLHRRLIMRGNRVLQHRHAPCLHGSDMLRHIGLLHYFQPRMQLLLRIRFVQ